MLAVASDHRLAGAARHQRSGRFDEGADLLADHLLRLSAALGATPGEFHKPKLNNLLSLQGKQGDGKGVVHAYSALRGSGSPRLRQKKRAAEATAPLTGGEPR